MYLNDTDSGWALVPKESPTEETVSGSIQKLLLLISFIRICVYIAGGILSSFFSGYKRWFAALFSIEAFAQFAVFVYEFLFIYEQLHTAEPFCNFLVMLMQYVHIVLIIAYMWAIHYFAFQPDKKEVGKYSTIIFLSLTIIAAAATIASAVQEKESVCISRAHIGWARGLMVVASIAECLAVPLLVVVYKKNPSNLKKKPEIALALIAAIAVRIPNIIQFFYTVHPHIQLVLRALPLAYPIAFTIIMIAHR